MPIAEQSVAIAEEVGVERRCKEVSAMRTTFRPIILSVTATLAAGVAGAADCPDGFPAGPIQMLVGYGAGGGTDAIARALATAMENQQGWTVVVDNRPGAGGGVMAAMLMNMAPDGQTIGVGATGTIALNPYESADTPYTYEDFDYLGSAMQIYYGLVALSDKPYSTLEEFMEYARENGGATISTGGKSQEILISQIAEHYDVELIPVPGKGAADALQQALGGHVDATTQGTQHVQQIKAGDMKQLASIIDRRVDYAPDSPTLIELGLDAKIDGQTIFIVPTGVDRPVLTCLEQAVDEAVQSESYGKLMVRLENEPLNLGPEGTLADMHVERVLGAIGIAFGILLLTVVIPRHVTSTPGFVNPARFPQLAAWLFVGLGTIQCFGAKASAPEVELRLLARLALVAACLVVTILAMTRIGYLASSIALMAAICAIMFERRTTWLAVTILATPIGVWLLFEVVLRRPLPSASLF
jgi:tripartite-type tricarboxylate transporter receptor subunit TctC